jgi:hypothetical protein
MTAGQSAAARLERVTEEMQATRAFQRCAAERADEQEFRRLDARLIQLQQQHRMLRLLIGGAR